MAWWSKNKTTNQRLVMAFSENALYLCKLILTQGSAIIQFTAQLDMKNRQQLQQQFAELCRSQHWHGIPTFVVLANEHYRMLQVERPDVPDAELAEAIKWRVKDLIEFPLDKVAVQCFEKPVDESRGMQKQSNVVVVQKELLQPMIDMLHDNSVSIQAIDIPELVIRNFLLLYPETEQGVAALVETCNGIYLILQKQDVVYLSRKLMSNNFQSVIDDLTQGYTDAAEQLILELHRSMDYFENQLGQAPVKHLLLGPVVEHSDEIVNYFESNLNLRILIIHFEGVLPEMPEALTPDMQGPYLLCVGAGLRRMEVA